MRSAWRAGARRTGAVAVASGLALALVGQPALAVGPIVGVECQALTSASTATAPDQDTALDLAQSCGQDVEIASARSPWSTFTATENGTVTQEVTATATRTAVSGTWGPVSNRITDPTPGDGTLSVSAPVYPITLSDGTAGVPLATINRDGHTLTYDSPFDLTEPVVEGESVTYPAVAGEGADLVVTINPDGTGISTALRLADRSAAKRADRKLGLDELTFPVTTSPGLTVTQSAAGGFDVVDAFGQPIFRAPQPKMWDSAASGDAPADTGTSGLFSMSGTPATQDTAGPTRASRWDQVSDEDAADPEARATAPLLGDQQLPMPVDLVPARARHTTDTETGATPGAVPGGDPLSSAPGEDLTGGELSVGGESLDAAGGFGAAGATEPSTVGVRIRPDRDFLLSDPDTVFPALIDPTVTSAGNEWLMVHEGTPDVTSGYMFEGNQGLGLCDVGEVAECNETIKFRLGWQFTGLDHLGLLEPGAITSATFSVFGEHSWDCTARTVRLFSTRPIDAASTWDTWGIAPFGTELSRVTVAHKEACDNAGWVDLDATAGVKNLASTDTGTLSLGLAALNETDMTQGWKRYRHDAKLTVEYEPPATSADAEGADLAARTENLDPAKEAADDAAPDAATPTPVPVSTPPEPTADPALVPVQDTPEAAEATLPVPETLTVVPENALGGLDLKIGAPAPTAGTPEASSEVHVEVADQAAAIGAGISGVLLDVTDTSAEAPPASGVRQVDVQVDYDEFTDLAGADWSGRLGIVRIPECHATTPDLEECSPTPVESTNDVEAGTVTATLDLAAAGTSAAAGVTAEKSADSTKSAAVETQASALAAGGGDTFAVTAGTSSGAGDWGATPLSSASSWSVSGATGSLGWSYPIQVPSPAAGPSPELALGYSSAALDGRVSSTNNQSSWVGDGWDMTSGFVERRYVPCSEDRDEVGGQSPNNSSRKTGDLCWDSDNAFLVFNGTSSALVKDDDAATTGAIEWRPESDDGTLVQQYGRPTGDAAKTDAGWAGEYWKVTTTDGTTYFFGKDERYSGDTLAQNSRWTVPVYSNHPNEPGYKAAFADSGRVMGWRFNLDYVRDTSDNTMTYRYASETNRYGSNNNTGATRSYTRGGTLDWISYGTRAGSEPVDAGGAGSPNLVDFAVAERCLVAATDCEIADRGTTAGAVRWHDTPVDLECSSSTSCPDVRSPAFFSTKRLTTVVTKVNVGGTLTAKDTVALTQKWRDPGDGTGRILWLDAIKRTANGPSSATSDDVVFSPIRFDGERPLPGRVADTVADGLPVMNRVRVTEITTETGANISIEYTSTECTAATHPAVAQGYIPIANQSANASRCFPVVWHPWGMPKPRSEYFHSYMVSKVTQSPGESGLDLPVVTSYAYSEGIKWARIDDPLTPKKDRTFSVNRGYKTVTTTTGTGSVAAKSRTQYLQGTGASIDLPVDSITTRNVIDHERFSGMPVVSTVLNGSMEVSKTITIPEATQTASTGSAGTDDLLVATRTTRVDTYNASYLADGSLEYVTRTDTDYDANGQVTEVDDYGAFSESAEDNTTSDDLCTTTDYVINGDKHIVAPMSTETVSVRCGADATRPADLVGESWISYDGLDHMAPPSKGLPTKVQTNDKDGVLNDATPGVVTTYDTRGRTTSSTDLLGRVSKTGYTEANGVLTQVTTTSPDPDGTGDGDGDGVTLTEHVSTTTLHPLLGVPTTVSDPNLRPTTATYDAAGRLLSVTYPDREGKSANVTYAYSTSRNGVNTVTTKTLAADGTSYHTSVALYDGLLRPVQTQTESLDGDDEATHGRIVTDTEYDANGRVSFVTSGWFATGNPSTTLVGAAVQPDATTVYTYDGLGRVRTEALFTGTIMNPAYEQWRTTTYYDGATTTVIPPDGATPTQTVVDARGRTVALSQFLRDPVEHAAVRTLAGVLDLDEQTTRYRYDKAGRLSSVLDTEDNTWTYKYDKLGRQIEAVDPDAGKTVTEYDAAGQTTSVSNGAGQKLYYFYDKLGRRTAVRQDSTTGAVRAKWTYDVLTSYAGPNPPIAKGQVTSSTRVATSADGGGEFVTALTGFDAAYRRTGTATVIPNTTKMAGLTGTYEQKVTYTADGQLASTTYPAAGGLRKETVTTHYDDETSVAEWMGGGFGWGTYVASSRTDVFGRLAYLDLGNTYGTVVSYGYETGTSRLQRVKLDRERIGGTELDLTYAYDDAGDVLSVKDRPTATGRAADRQCYQYDSLRRMTEAWTPATGNCGLTRSIPALGGAAPYWTSFEYDALGNRTSEIYRTRGLAGDIDGGQTTTMDYSYAGSRDLNGNGNSTDVGEFAGPHAVTSITTDGPSGSTASTFTYDNAGRTLTQIQDRDYLTTKLSLGWDHETELASTSLATTVYAEPDPGSGDDDTDGDQSSGMGPDRGTGTTTTTAGRNLYTADGDRIVRTAPDGSITVYLGGQEITKVANGTVTGARYYSFGGQTVAMRTANGLSGVTSLINDPHGTPLASVHNTNWTTTSVDKHYTLPFGEQRGGVSAPGDHEFLGKVRDEGTGLTLVGARWYDETTGRFLTVDPVIDLTHPQQWNAYAYANNNPATYSDPSGMRPEECVGGWYACTVNANGNWSVNSSKSDAGSWDPVSPGKIWAGLKSNFLSIVNGVKERAKVVYNIGSACSWGTACFYSGVILHDSVGAYEAGKDAFTEKSEFEKKVTAGDTNGLIADGISTAAVAVTTKRLLPKTAPLHGADKAPACNSFAPGTLVLLADSTLKPIEDVELGDKVLAADEETGEPTEGRVVTALIRGEGDKTLATLTVTDADGDTQQIVATDAHPFWAPELGEWVDAIDLTAGDWLQTSVGTWVQVTAIAVSQRKAVVHNLTVAVDHTYYVAADERSSALLVHNDNCPITGYSHGDLGEMAELDRLINDGYTDIASEVTFLAPDGTKFRADFVARDPDGVLKAIEVKTNNGGLTDNQYVGYPQLSTVGSEVRTDKLAGIGFPRGSTIKLDVEVSLWKCPSC
ncbi:polymorphic toxin-type HINT domain-containing protein [Promicromonospora sp. MEB111]|uniref:polymorphic toxin-type HINT domain-containing protein n=1 Tax=Promicromonospora sp. MEB111 TaxID=3040301 RepID=UPI0025517DAF|nr:polymorphic toxin-type HINT domain-containing protein [Promicromonospora sp. MEB111]